MCESAEGRCLMVSHDQRGDIPSGTVGAQTGARWDRLGGVFPAGADTPHWRHTLVKSGLCSVSGWGLQEENPSPSHGPPR